MTGAVRFAVLVFVGLLTAQAAWILAVPPFHAIDEIDHVYRATGVAAGEWRVVEVPEDGRGLVTSVPQDIVEAASAQCHSLDSMAHDNCTPISQHDGRAEITSAAGAYHPLYYAAVGAAGLPFEGAAADYAMRVTTAVACALAVAFAAWCLAAAGAGLWTRLGLVVSLTPGLIYTTVVPAPNGVEIVAGLCLWAALLALGQVAPGGRRATWMVVVAATSSTVLVTPRVLGPMWVLLIVGVAGVFLGRSTLVALWRHHRRLLLGSAAVVGAATAGSAWWTLTAELTDATSGLTSGQPVEDLELGAQPVVWLLQIIGAFPFRDSPAPMVTYATFIVIVLGMIIGGLRAAPGRARLAIAGALLIVLLLPVLLTYLTAAEQGIMWQGRYGLPLVVGILPMCGLVLDRGEPRRSARRVAVTTVGMLAVAHAWSVWQVAERETARSVFSSDTWITLPPWALAGITVVAIAVLGRAVLAPQVAGDGHDDVASSPGSVGAPLPTAVE